MTERDSFGIINLKVADSRNSMKRHANTALKGEPMDKKRFLCIKNIIISKKKAMVLA